MQQVDDWVLSRLQLNVFPRMYMSVRLRVSGIKPALSYKYGTCRLVENNISLWYYNIIHDMTMIATHIGVYWQILDISGMK